MSRTGLALRALRLTVTGSKADPTPDYDVAGPSYDDYFTRVMGEHASALLDSMSFRPGATVVELACGTGHLTAQIARRLAGQGTIRAVDKSPGMLAVARQKLARFGDLDVQLQQGDMTEFLRGLPSGSADAVVCGWAICYSRPATLLREIARVLRPGTGEVGLIETRKDALGALRHAFEQVVADDPALLTAMIQVSLPRSKRTVDRWFRRAGLAPVRLFEGEQRLPCRTAAEAVEWVERSGAGAGFRDAFDPGREHEVRARLAAELDRHAGTPGGVDLRHTFVRGVARRGGAAAQAGGRR
jgi:ubiquinone/menaquinone biosynthesis C-methylase UbiE